MVSLVRWMTTFNSRKPLDITAVTDDFIVSDFSHVKLPALPDVRGMISDVEGRYLFWLASAVYGGEGAAIEVGTWLGRSTVHLAAGLRVAHPGKRLTCFDHFEWAKGANWPQATGTHHDPGSDFMPDFLHNTSQFADIITAKKCKIKDITLADDQIEIAVLDAPKRVGDVSAILTQLSDRIIPGKTILAWQDFMHAPSFEIAACLYAIAEHLEPVHAVTDGCLVAFKVRQKWAPRQASVSSLSFGRWSVDRARSAWTYWAPLVPDSLRPRFHAGLAMLLHDLGKPKEAKEEFLKVADDPLLRVSMKKWRETSLARRYTPLFQLIS